MVTYLRARVYQVFAVIGEYGAVQQSEINLCERKVIHFLKSDRKRLEVVHFDDA